MNHDLKWCTANNSIIFLFVLFWAYGHYMIDSYLNEPRFKVMQRPMTKMNAFLRGVSPAVCRNLQFWNIAFSFNFDIYIFNWLYTSAVPSGTFRGFIPGYIHSCCQKASISQSCNVSKEPTSEVYPAMFILKYFWGVPSHVYTQILLQCTQPCLHSNTGKSTFFSIFSEKTRGSSSNTGSMQKAWKQKNSLCQAQVCILTGTLVPSMLWRFLHQLFSVSFCSLWK